MIRQLKRHRDRDVISQILRDGAARPSRETSETYRFVVRKAKRYLNERCGWVFPAGEV